MARPLVPALACALAFALVTAGCSSPSAPTPSVTSQELTIEEANDPRFAQGPGGFVILWNFSFTWHPARPSGDVNVTLDVKLYGRQPAGTGAQDTTFAPGETKILQFRTQFLGIGDYRYTVQARDASGALVGERIGMFETCVC